MRKSKVPLEDRLMSSKNLDGVSIPERIEVMESNMKRLRTENKVMTRALWIACEGIESMTTSRRLCNNCIARGSNCHAKQKKRQFDKSACISTMFETAVALALKEQL